MKKALVLAALLLSAAIAHAQPAVTSDIPIPVPGDGTVAPGSTLYVPLDGLMANIYYTVDCKVTNNSSVNVGMQFGYSCSIGACTASQPNFTLNGALLNSANQGMLKPGLNDMQGPAISLYNNPNKGNVLTFVNADDTTPVQVSNCVAHFMAKK